MSQECNKTSSIGKGITSYVHSRTGKLNLVYFGPQTAKNKTRVLAYPPATVERTGINKTVAFARWQHGWAAIRLGIAMCLVFVNFMFWPPVVDYDGLPSVLTCTIIIINEAKIKVTLSCHAMSCQGIHYWQHQHTTSAALVALTAALSDSRLFCWMLCSVCDDGTKQCRDMTFPP